MHNKIILGGKIVSEIEVRQSKTGIPVCDFRLMYKNKKAKEPLFIDIEVWSEEATKLGEAVKANQLQRKDQVLIEGELRQDTWEKDGVKRSKIKITADKVTIVTTENTVALGFTENTPAEEPKSF